MIEYIVMMGVIIYINIGFWIYQKDRVDSVIGKEPIIIPITYIFSWPVFLLGRIKV